ncbi:hypothetical protein DPMN_127833 [Dreissena polymorpha]|uniref:MOSC domain-containing protein n=1 Tax=Dreissena polymorpha TaxID=45954 RepID=A0A9D4GYB6_DREPO|nr:hypothetical protein DPMN_127833 [Dreissena polymorpha]
MLDISQMTFTLAQFFHHQLTSCHHGNGSCLAEVYCEDNFQNIETQGAIVTFNLLRANGNYIGFSEVEKLGQLYNIHFRTGCFCNIGACQKYLKMSDEQIQGNFSAGHVCGDDLDLIDGRPTGAVRVSFGYMSTMLDAQRCLQFIVDCFLESCDKQVFCSKNIWQPVGKTVSASDSSKVSEKNNVNTQLLNDITVNASDTQYDNTIVNEEKSSLAQSSNIENTKVSQQLSGKVNKMMVCVEMNFETPSEIRKVNTKLEQLIQNKEHSYGDLNPDIVTMVTEETEEFEACEGRVLADIFLYPVKSCAAFRVTRWPLCSRGLLYDREWMIVTETGIALTQKREYRLCLLRPSIDLLSGQLILAFPGMNVLRLSLTDMVGDQNEASLCNGKVCGDRVSSVDCGDVVADWLSEALCRPGCRLIRQAADDTRASKLKSSIYDSTGSDMRLSLSNESQYLMITQDSAAALHQKILERYQEGDADACFDVNNLVDRFRANLVVRGCSPFEEDTWSSVQIGKLHFQSQGQCSRCQMVCMDQSSGERSGEPLKTLAVWRGKKIPFGIHLGHAWKVERDFTEIQVGDPVFLCGTPVILNFVVQHFPNREKGLQQNNSGSEQHRCRGYGHVISTIAENIVSDTHVNNLVDRFRANLVVRGCSPFEEDTWSSVQIGKLHFQSQGQCSRCQMVCMDQSSGERSGEPLKTLAVWHGKKIPFGIHLGHAWKVERDFTEIQKRAFSRTTAVPSNIAAVVTVT